jgi:hypothetical protein
MVRTNPVPFVVTGRLYHKLKRWEGAQRLGLVTLEQMIAALVHAVENPATGTRVVAVPQIRALQA